MLPCRAERLKAQEQQQGRGRCRALVRFGSVECASMICQVALVARQLCRDGLDRALVNAGPAVDAGICVDRADAVYRKRLLRAFVHAHAAADAFVGVDGNSHVLSTLSWRPLRLPKISTGTSSVEAHCTGNPVMPSQIPQMPNWLGSVLLVIGKHEVEFLDCLLLDRCKLELRHERLGADAVVLEGDRRDAAEIALEVGHVLVHEHP